MSTFSEWIGKNSEEMKRMVRGIVKGDDDLSDELFQSVVLQLLEKPKKVDDVPDHHKVFYFIRVVKNNYYSKTSPFQYRRIKDRNRNIQIDEGLTSIEDVPYEEPFEYMSWVVEQLSDEELFSWYERDIFMLYVELTSYVRVSKKTTIPVNSVSRHLKQVKEKLLILWEEKQQSEQVN
tara:strand:+ start:3283 stop:3816 length:534 start_codon:yes stop_codon:yes gene_type:complete